MDKTSNGVLPARFDGESDLAIGDVYVNDSGDMVKLGEHRVEMIIKTTAPTVVRSEEIRSADYVFPEDVIVTNKETGVQVIAYHANQRITHEKAVALGLIDAEDPVDRKQYGPTDTKERPVRAPAVGLPATKPADNVVKEVTLGDNDDRDKDAGSKPAK